MYTKQEVSVMMEVLGWLIGNRLLVDGAIDDFAVAMRDNYKHEALPSMMGPYCVACRVGLDDTYTRHISDAPSS